jgi:hypothetical protein
MKPGDEIVGDDGGRFILGDLVATQGKADCTNPGCRRRFAPGDPPEGICAGYHCPKCGEPTGMMGHRCPRDN